MEPETRVKRRSGIRRIFVRGLLGAMMTTALFSAIVVGFGLFFILQISLSVPEAESSATSLENYAKNRADALLSGTGSARSDFETRIHEANAENYALLNERGKPLAGEASEFEPLPSVEQLAGQLNNPRTIQKGRYVESSVPLVRDRQVDGYLLLRYEPSLLDNPAIGTPEKVKLGSLLVLMVLLPMLLLAASTLLFARRASSRLGKPIGELREAVEKIRNQDLNFTVDYDEPDELGELCGALRDLRDELEGSLAREWQVRQDLEDTIATLSHDLRTPTTVIRGHVESLSRVQDKEKRAERLERYLPVLDTAASRMSKLLDDILVAANPEAQPAPNRLLEIKLTEEMTHKARMYELLSEERGVAFLWKVVTQVDNNEVVNVNFEAFERVLDNLFENALAFTPKGGTISVEASWNEHELEITVQDTGPGLDPEDLPHVFEKGYQGKRKGTHRKSNSGLGLYISLLLVQQSGGKIQIENRCEGGMEVTFALPLASVNV